MSWTNFNWLLLQAAVTAQPSPQDSSSTCSKSQVKCNHLHDSLTITCLKKIPGKINDQHKINRLKMFKGHTNFKATSLPRTSPECKNLLNSPRINFVHNGFSYSTPHEKLFTAGVCCCRKCQTSRS